LALRAWLEDVAERKSLHLEMVAIPALVTLGSVAGRLVAIRPEPFDDWEVVPNLWGAVVARPGMMKTAALSVGTDPLKPLIAKAYDEYSEAREPAEAKIRALQSEIKQMSRAAEKAKDPTPIDRDRMTEALREIEQSAVRPKRYMAKDATVEMLAELISENPRGLLVVRDELSAWLGNLAKPGRDGDRGFYLEAWDGNGSHVVDRIGRGTTHIPALCLGVLGTIQPGLMSKLVSGADAHGDKDDGLVQRFQLFVWPDALRDYKEPTRRPNVHAKSKAYEVYQWAAAATAPMLNACVPESRSRMPFVGFDSAAQELWKEWRREFEARIRDAEVQSFPSYASHIAKYRSMVPSIALLDHLADLAGGGTRSDVGRPSLERAIRWAEYLDAHARKLYGVASPALVAAHRLAARVTEGSIESRMTVRKVKRKDWSGLTSDEDVYGGLNVLESLGWLRVVKMKTGGAPSYVIELRPDHEAALDDLTAKTDKSPDTASEPDLSSVLSVPSESSTPESASPQISETWECIT
jgi:putative DNA primase/helicase